MQPHFLHNSTKRKKKARGVTRKVKKERKVTDLMTVAK